MEDNRTLIRLDIKGIQKLVSICVEENTEEFVEYVKQTTAEQLDCMNLEDIIKMYITSAFRDKVQRFFMYGEGKDMLDKEFLKLFTKEVEDGNHAEQS